MYDHLVVQVLQTIPGSTALNDHLLGMEGRDGGGGGGQR